MLLLFAVLASATAHAAPGQYITGAIATPVDQDSDGLFDVLEVAVTLQAPAEGLYNLRVTVAWPEPSVPTPIASKSDIFQLSGLPQMVTLSVEGPRIREYGLDGPYEVQVILISSPSGPVDDAATFMTAAMLASDFAQGPDTGKPRVVWGESDVTLASPELSAAVNLSAPTVEWGPRGGGDVPGRFLASFLSVVTFNDDGDGALAGDELPLCTAPIGGEPWTVETLDIGPSPDWGEYIRFSLSADVQFAGPGCTSAPGGQVRLGFLIGQHNGTVQGPSPYPLVGGLEVKVDIGLTLDAPVSGDALAMEVTLEDLEANTSFRVRGPSGYETIDPSNQSAAMQAFDRAAQPTLETVAFTDRAGAERGHFSWVPVATQLLAQGQERFVEVSASRGVGASLMRLYLAVPNDPGLVSLSLDPAVGVPPTVTLPQGGGDGGQEPPAERPSFTIFVAALLAVAAIFFLSVYARAKKY